MAKSSCAVLLLLIINVGNYFVMGQSTTGDCSNDEQDKYNNDGSYALAKSILSEFQNLKAQIGRLENRVDPNMNDSIQQIKRQMQTEHVVIKDQIGRLENRVERQKLFGSQCPNGFNYTAIGFPKCYAVLRQAADWNTAQQKCRELHKDAHLAVINWALEQQIITKIIRNYNCLQINYDTNRGERSGDYFWVGGQLRNVSDCSSVYKWKPDDGTSLPVDYSNWHDGEPNCSPATGLIENCIGIRPDGQWNDVPCSWNFCSLCEVTVYI